MTTINEPMGVGATMGVEPGPDGDPTTLATTKTVPAVESDEDVNPAKTEKRKCCGCFQGYPMGFGYTMIGLAKGAVVMSNIYLSGSLLLLACNESGGVDPTTNECVDPDLPSRGGMKPSAIISNIALVSGLLSAFFMPVFGAIVDFTDHRKLLGILSSALLTGIQAIQIGTIENTWFAMAILQVIAGFLYQVVIAATYAYLPEMGRDVGQKQMNNYTAIFTQTQFAAQATFSIIVIGISFALGLSTVHTAMVGQTAVALCGIVFFSWGWIYLPARTSKHTLRDGQWLVTAGFAQNWKTAKSIWSQYRKGLKWYLLALIFAEASAASVTNISIIYLNDVVGLNIMQVGIFFLVALVFTIPGAKIGSIITHKTNPNTSWKLSQLALLIGLVIGAMTLDNLKGPKELSFIWAAAMGILLGWLYPTENLFFSMCLPQGQEAELAGFYVYCTQILGWLPPLIFTILVQANVPQRIGVIATSFGFLVSVFFLSCASSWDEIMEEADHNKNVDLVGDDVDEGKGKTSKKGSDEEDVEA